MNRPIASFAAGSAVKARFTTAEFVRMAQAGAFDDMKVDLVDGELERVNPPMSSHGSRQARIAIRLAAIIPETLLTGETGIDLGDDTVMACDVAVLRHPVVENRLLVPNDMVLVVEVAESTIARDMGLKRLAYARAEIAHYWVIDSGRSVVHVYAEPIDGEYAQVRTVRFGESLPVPGTDGTIVID